MYLWRAIDSEGELPDLLVQPKRNKAAAFKLIRKLLKKQGFPPSVLVTDRLPSYGAAQHFLSVHSAIYNTFSLQRHLISRRTLRLFRAQAAEQWRSATIPAETRQIFSPLAARS